jgi:hypothetical protein
MSLLKFHILAYEFLKFHQELLFIICVIIIIDVGTWRSIIIFFSHDILCSNQTGPFDFSRLAEFSSYFWTLGCSSWSWSKCVDSDELFYGAFDDDLLLLLESYICSSTFQRRLALSGQPYSISISSFISALKALDKVLDAHASRYRHFFCPYIWGQSFKVWEMIIFTIHQIWGFISHKYEDIWVFHETKSVPSKWSTSTEGMVMQVSDIIFSPND